MPAWHGWKRDTIQNVVHNLFSMANFLSSFSFSHFLSDMRRTCIRFPLSVLLSIGVSGIFFYMIHMESSLDQAVSEILVRSIFTGIVLFFLSVATVLFLEMEPKKIWKTLVMYSVILLFGAGFYYTLSQNQFESAETITFLFLTFFGFFTFLFYSPFVRQLFWKEYKEAAYVKYFYSMATVFLMSAIMGWLLWGLGSIAIWSVEVLFEPTFITANTFAYWAVIALALKAPIFGLSRIPTRESIEKGEGRENVFFTFLVKFVGLPFLAIYFIILYAYSVKVLMNFSDWPKWQVSWMVIGFSIFGYILYIFSHALEKEYELVARFRKVFPFIVIPQIAMLFYAIWLRIEQYDFTMNRYFVVVFGIWLTVISLYFVISKVKKLAYIPAILSVFIVLISVGPWSVYQFPFARQEARFLENLREAHILSGTTITPLPTYNTIGSGLSSEIYDGIQYLCEYDNCKMIKTLFAHELEAALKKQTSDWEASDKKYRSCQKEQKGGCYREVYSKDLSSWEIRRIIAEQIKVQALPYDTIEATPALELNVKWGVEWLFPLPVGKYEYIYQVIGKNAWNINTPNRIQFDMKEKKAEFFMSGALVDIFPLESLLTSLNAISQKKSNMDGSNLSKEEMTFDVTGKKYVWKLYLQGVTFPNPAYTGSTDNWNYSADGYMLIRAK